MFICLVTLHVIVVAIILATAITGVIDRRRLAADVGKRGGRVVQIDAIHYGSWHRRLYRVIYLDKKAYPHSATFEASLASGVICDGDRVIGSPLPA